jgi:hypothetical protein
MIPLLKRRRRAARAPGRTNKDRLINFLLMLFFLTLIGGTGYLIFKMMTRWAVEGLGGGIGTVGQERDCVSVKAAPRPEVQDAVNAWSAEACRGWSADGLQPRSAARLTGRLIAPGLARALADA